MAERARGNVFYEIIIVILIIGLVGSILYPSMVWHNEEEFQDVCRTRMETINQLEYFYMMKQSEPLYSDSIPALVNQLLSDPNEASSRDSLIYWDALVTRKDLKFLFFQKQFPEDLRGLIQESFEGGKPLGNLVIWDSLQYRLLAQVQGILDAPDFTMNSSIDSSIDWITLVREHAFWNILDTPEINARVRRRTRSQVQRGSSIIETSAWEQYRPFFYERFRNTLQTAVGEDVWQQEDEDVWEKGRRETWNAEMDGLSQNMKDSLWQELRQRFWDRDKELIWKAERNGLWKSERAAWQEENTSAWRRSLVETWKSDRKKEWEDETLASLPDSLVVLFPVEKDSVWKSVVDSIQAEEYEAWELANTKFATETMRNIWESERRVSWEDGAHREWLAEKEGDKGTLWEEIKEDRWNSERPRLWREEGTKLDSKISAQRRLDRSIKWANMLGMDRIQGIVNQLRLPDNQTLWKEVEKRIKQQAASFSAQRKTSILHDVGIVGLFRKTLLDSLETCPLAHVPYHVHAVDTAVIKRFSIRCPIVDTAEIKIALNIDPITKDTSEVILEMSKFQKLLGGGALKDHGDIDEDGKKSWEKKGI